MALNSMALHKITKIANAIFYIYKIRSNQVFRSFVSMVDVPV